ncbi:MAG: dihydroorotase [Myxococcales bacterium]|nr:dihydroorotase [Myxococcales bacterium]
MEMTLRRPDDWHVHLRDGQILQAVAPHTARWMGRAIVMPNLKPPIRTVHEALAYRRRILEAVDPSWGFDPLMTLYLSEQTTPDDVRAAARADSVKGVKLYPAHATTNSDAGVGDFREIEDVLAAMEDLDVPLLVHGEVTDTDVDVFDREAAFIERVLQPIADRHPGLRIVLEHVTTAEGVEFVRRGSERIGATVTAHHLVLNRSDLFSGGLRPHHYCLPVPKRENHRRALVEAVTSGHPRFFAGTDSAPHLVADKESDCGCAGVFSAPTAISVYAEVFEQQDKLQNLEGFLSLHGPRFYGLEPSEERIRLSRAAWTPPRDVATPSGPIRVFRGGAKLAWTVFRER